MSEIKVLDELREYAEQCCPAYEDYDARMMEIADAVEAEIAERYIELPVDADGVPVRVGDELECHANGYDGAFTVFAIGNDVVVGNHDIEWLGRNPSKWFHVASFCTHAKPRTIEDALNDFGEKVWNTACAPEGYTWSNANLDADLERCAEEIRGLMGKDGRV